MFAGRLSQIWIQVMQGTGEFVVLQEPPDELESEFGGPDPQASDRNPEIVIIRGKIKMYEPPLRGPKSPKTQSADGIGNTMDFKDISNRLFGDSEAMDGLATKDVTDLRMCSKGKYRASFVKEISMRLFRLAFFKLTFANSFLRLNSIICCAA